MSCASEPYYSSRPLETFGGDRVMSDPVAAENGEKSGTTQSQFQSRYGPRRVHGDAPAFTPRARLPGTSDPLQVADGWLSNRAGTIFPRDTVVPSKDDSLLTGNTSLGPQPAREVQYGVRGDAETAKCPVSSPTPQHKMHITALASHILGALVHVPAVQKFLVLEPQANGEKLRKVKAALEANGPNFVTDLNALIAKALCDNQSEVEEAPVIKSEGDTTSDQTCSITNLLQQKPVELNSSASIGLDGSEVRKELFPQKLSEQRQPVETMRPVTQNGVGSDGACFRTSIFSNAPLRSISANQNDNSGTNVYSRLPFTDMEDGPGHIGQKRKYQAIMDGKDEEYVVDQFGQRLSRVSSSTGANETPVAKSPEASAKRLFPPAKMSRLELTCGGRFKQPTYDFARPSELAEHVTGPLERSRSGLHASFTTPNIPMHPTRLAMLGGQPSSGGYPAGCGNAVASECPPLGLTAGYPSVYGNDIAAVYPPLRLGRGSIPTYGADSHIAVPQRHGDDENHGDVKIKQEDVEPTPRPIKAIINQKKPKRMTANNFCSRVVGDVRQVIKHHLKEAGPHQKEVVNAYRQVTQELERKVFHGLR